MTNRSLFGADGKPDINAIDSYFPEHGSGQINHCSTLGDRFTVDLHQSRDGYEAVILSQPGYGSRSNGLHETHRLPGPDGYAKICFAKLPQDLPTAVALTVWWAECTSRYIRSGERFK